MPSGRRTTCDRRPRTRRRPPPKGRPCEAEPDYLTAALSLEPAVTLTRLPAGILISAPVCGLRPVRAAVATCSKEIQPGIETLLPLATASETVANRASRTPETAAWLWPVALAMLATSSVLVMDLSAISSSSDGDPVASYQSSGWADAPRWSNDRLECINQTPVFRVISRFSTFSGGVSRLISPLRHSGSDRSDPDPGMQKGRGSEDPRPLRPFDELRDR
ncbi:hypothetical protein MICRO8M_10120 [Microbacterium sp. 8M]|nr:hypothetical protein MICRO8M_10120 [Microbacterium sp. 8M]